MTVSLLHRMQEPPNSKSKQNSSKKQHPKQQTAIDSDTSISCAPANQQPPFIRTEEEQNDTAATTTQNESLDECWEYFAEDPIHQCLVDTLSASAGDTNPTSRLSGGISVTKVSPCDTDLSTIPSGARNPPPSEATAGSRPSRAQPTESAEFQSSNWVELAHTCVLADKLCVHLSEDVPAPSKTDAIARVSREDLYQYECCPQDDEDSDVYASGEEWEDDKKSEYSTADEDYESLFQKMVEKRALVAKQEDIINESEDSSTKDGNSVDFDVTYSARTNASVNRDPCGPTFAILDANSDALRPVLVRQVSQEEDVRVTSDDDENDQLGHYAFDRDHEEHEMQDDRDEAIIPMQYTYCEREEAHQQPSHTSHDTATSPIQARITRQAQFSEDRCDEGTEAIHWSEMKSNKSVASAEESAKTSVKSVESRSLGLIGNEPKEKQDSRSGRWRSLPTLSMAEPYENTMALCESLRSREIQRQQSPMYPAFRTAERYSEPVPSRSHQQKMEERRVRGAMVEALAVCEQELGPLAVLLAELQEKVRRLNLPEIDALRRPITTPVCRRLDNFPTQAPSVTLISRGAQGIGTPMIAAGPSNEPPQQRISGSQMSRLPHDVNCFCRCCGLQMGAKANLSPMARMYILLAQPHRNFCEEKATEVREDRKFTDFVSSIVHPIVPLRSDCPSFTAAMKLTKF